MSCLCLLQKVVLQEAEIVGVPGVNGGPAASTQAAATPASLPAAAVEQPDNKKRRKKSRTPQLQSQPAAVAPVKRSAGGLEACEPSQEQNGLPASNGASSPFELV